MACSCWRPSLLINGLALSLNTLTCPEFMLGQVSSCVIFKKACHRFSSIALRRVSSSFKYALYCKQVVSRLLEDELDTLRACSM
uniref:Putative secreted protein n=1 Tax=Anopheles triannulatus TaxID=58253 RepID=A0A2M4B5C9_9DIPT